MKWKVENSENLCPLFEKNVRKVGKNAIKVGKNAIKVGKNENLS